MVTTEYRGIPYILNNKLPATIQQHQNKKDYIKTVAPDQQHTKKWQQTANHSIRGFQLLVKRSSKILPHKRHERADHAKYTHTLQGKHP